VGEQATVNTTTRGFGASGIANINAREIKVIGSINSSALKPSTNGQAIFQTPSVPSGSPGELNIRSEHLTLTDGGQLSVTNEGTSTVAGTLRVNSSLISLENKSSINASTASGEGGDIFLTSDTLNLRDSSITATASDNGNGGNITIATNILTSKNSNIIANAYLGRGGNIKINAQGVFPSGDSQITASSEKGINGTVKINTQERYLNQIPSPTTAFSQNPEIVSVCQGRSNSEKAQFVITGTGGLPPSPEDLPDIHGLWQQNPIATAAQETDSKNSEDTTAIVEAQGWIQNPDGSIVLTAEPNAINAGAAVSANPCQSENSGIQVSQNKAQQ
jgi:large exoprotein involved in heme utilization and adhesion